MSIPLTVWAWLTPLPRNYRTWHPALAWDTTNTQASSHGQPLKGPAVGDGHLTERKLHPVL